MDIRTEERYEDDFNQGNLFIMKRSGERVPFDESKIVRAIEKANASGARTYREIRVRSTQKLPRSCVRLPMKPRISANITAIPAAALTKFCVVSANICVK